MGRRTGHHGGLLTSRRHPVLVVLAPVAIAVAIGAVVTATLLARTDALELARIRPVRVPAALAVVVAATLGNVVLRWARWHALARALGVSLPARPSLRFWVGTLPASLTPLAVGELVRAAVLGRASARAGRVLTVVWVLERGSDVVALVVIALVANGELGTALVSGCVGGAVLFGLLVGAGRWLEVPRATRKAPLAAGLSLVAWSLPAMATAAAATILVAGVGASDAADAFAVGTLLGGLSLLPGGAGLTGTTFIDRLQDAGATEQMATLVTLVVRLGTLWFALALGLLVLWMSWSVIAGLVRGVRAQTHFDELSPSYGDEIPAHVRDRVVGRKLDALCERVGRPSIALDLGCGPGWYAAGLLERGTAVVPVDLSVGQLLEARATLGDRFAGCAADGCRLPFAEASFDAVYAVNSLHHLPDRRAQAAALAEVVRVLRPGGVFALCEINTENPLFRLYMGYIFPLLRRIDDGTELWLRPSALPPVAGATWSSTVDYQTFLPDFLPLRLLDALSPLERRLEESRLRGWSAHYQAYLVKEGAPAPAAPVDGDGASSGTSAGMPAAPASIPR